MKRSLLKDIISNDSSGGNKGTFGSFLHGSIKTKALKESLTGQTLTHELTVFIEDSSFLSAQVGDVKKILFKHWKKDEYDTPLAERAWGRVVAEAAKKYTVHTVNDERLWEEVFPTDVRQAIAEGLEQSYHTDLKRGKVDIEGLFNE